MPAVDAQTAAPEAPAVRTEATTFGFLELSQFLIELAQRRAFGRLELVVQRGRIGMVKWEEHFKPGELPIRDTARLERLKNRSKDGA